MRRPSFSERSDASTMGFRFPLHKAAKQPVAGITTAKKKSDTVNGALIQDVCLPSAH